MSLSKANLDHKSLLKVTKEVFSLTPGMNPPDPEPLVLELISVTCPKNSLCSLRQSSM